MIRFLLHRPIAVCVTALSLAVLGILAVQQLPVSLLPDIPVPEITVQASYPPASARELQRTIEQPLRNQLLQVNHLEDIESVVQDGTAVLTLRFHYGTNIRLAYLETNEKIDGILGRLPRNMERPKVIKAGAGDIPVFNLNIIPEASYRHDFLAVSEFCENVLKRRIEQLPEVALVDATGLARPEFVVQFNPDKLSSLGLSEQQIADRLHQANLAPGNFTVRDGQYHYSIRLATALQSPEDVENLTFAVDPEPLLQSAETNNRPTIEPPQSLQTRSGETRSGAADPGHRLGRRLITLREIGRVFQQERPLRGMYTFNGRRAVCLAIIKQQEAQLLDLRQQLNSQLRQFEKDYPGLRFRLSQDQTELLDLSISNLISNLLTGALLTLVMIFFFMRDRRPPLLIGLIMPVSLCVTFLGFYLLGLSINILSLAGLVLGVGEIIDSAIIILESIEEKWQNGASLEEACIQGAEEVIRPLFTSVLTNSAVFLPLLLLSGIAGALFFDQAVSVSLALGVSLLSSYLLVPVLYFALFRKTAHVRPVSKLTRLMKSVETAYNAFFFAAFRAPRRLLSGLALFVIGAFWLGSRLEKQGMPTVSRTELEVHIDWNEPLAVEENKARIQVLTQQIRPTPVSVSAFTGQQQFLLNRRLQQTESEALLSIHTATENEFPELIAEIRRQIRRRYPSASVETRPARNVFEQLFSTDEPPLRLKLYSARSRQSPPPETAARIAAILKRLHYPFTPPATREYRAIRLRMDRLLLYEVDEERLIQHLKTLFNGDEVTTLQQEQRLIPVVLVRPTENCRSWESVRVANRRNEGIPLKELVELTTLQDFKTIHADKLGVYLPFDLPLPPTRIEEVRDRLQPVLTAETTVSAGWSGRYFRDQGYIRELAGIILVAVALLFCILTAQFESIRQPLVVLLIIALGLSGAVWALFLGGDSINVLSAIGAVVLIGLLDNDSILKIDTMNRSRDRLDWQESLREAGLRRLKSQSMTFLTTVLGLLPVLFSRGLGADLQRPLALTVIGGMCVGILVSWTLIPLLYRIIARRRSD